MIVSSHKILNVSEYGVLETYESQLLARGYTADPAQRAAMVRLQELYVALLAFKAARRSKLRKMLVRPDVPKSVYLWGGVGRGKSFLMDCFFDAVPYRRKRRVHFHAFMQEVQNDLRHLNHLPDPLQKVADRIAAQTRLLCFDEFHVSDIADAMILGRLLEALFGRGVIFVMTSNYPPDGLYPDGLMRINFLPAIKMIKARFDVLEVDNGYDYRLRALEEIESWLVPADAGADARLVEDFWRLTGIAPQAGEIEVLDRRLSVRGRADDVIWFDFDVLCRTARSQNDYLEIARTYHTVLLSNIPVMRASEASEARRFTWLIDVLYDFRVKFVASAAGSTYELYIEGVHANEFVRTVSRLIEMRTHEYLAEPHRQETLQNDQNDPET
ncbi:MAG: cell division protein ZapE [Betaproteobacteria bacterium]|nr:cell division protein ZapE [Betaproteobacteria bacterium]